MHFLKPITHGVEMRDEVYYKIPFSLLGDAANYLVVRRKIRQIFNYRFKALEERFGTFPA
jgi:hypothetical protein